MKSLKRLIFFYSILLLVVSCSGNENNGQPAADSLIAATSARTIHSYYNTPEKKEFEMHCITCHSYRYIQMQPAFPRKTWEKIVDKMVKNFGAPIPDSSTKKIVDYLMVIKGK